VALAGEVRADDQHLAFYRMDVAHPYHPNP
jgi:hypothetical protein